jgi:hypothetical protein
MERFMLLIDLFLSHAITEAAQAPIVAQRNQAIEVPLPSDSVGGPWGPAGRMADHATVAINSDKDIFVAYHTDRDDADPGKFLKQVEGALFEYDLVTDSWTLGLQVRLGDVDPDPLVLQSPVKCERPDVIAVGDMFFVVWTRRYEFVPTDPNQPAVLECAWIKKDSSGTYQVHDSGTAGLGIELDRNYHIRECSGVPDAVFLSHVGNDWTVGVVYPDQTKFSDAVPLGERLFNLKMATCTINVQTNAVSKSKFTGPLKTGVKFHGGSGDSAGLVLPDLSPGAVTNRFILAYEEQLGAGNGRIRLQTWDLDASGLSATEGETHTFGGPSSQVPRRRPNVSSHPESAGGLDVVSIAFSQPSAAGDGDVIHQLWSFAFGSLQIPWPPGFGWFNDATDDIKPVPVHGQKGATQLQDFRRVLVERNASPCSITEYDPMTNTYATIGASSFGAGRPAASYRYDAGAASPHYLAITWEQKDSATDEYSIFLRVR